MKGFDRIHRLNQEADEQILPKDEARLAIRSIIPAGSFSRIFAEDLLHHDIWIFAGDKHTRIPMPETPRARHDIEAHPLPPDSAHLAQALKSRSQLETLSRKLHT